MYDCAYVMSFLSRGHRTCRFLVLPQGAGQFSKLSHLKDKDVTYFAAVLGRGVRRLRYERDKGKEVGGLKFEGRKEVFRRCTLEV